MKNNIHIYDVTIHYYTAPGDSDNFLCESEDNFDNILTDISNSMDSKCILNFKVRGEKTAFVVDPSKVSRIVVHEMDTTIIAGDK